MNSASAVPVAVLQIEINGCFIYTCQHPTWLHAVHHY